MRALVLLVNRLVWFVPTLIGLMVITFTISHIIPAVPMMPASTISPSSRSCESSSVIMTMNTAILERIHP